MYEIPQIFCQQAIEGLEVFNKQAQPRNENKHRYWKLPAINSAMKNLIDLSTIIILLSEIEPYSSMNF